MMKEQLKKQMKEFRRERAMSELTLKICALLYKFESKEEPSIKLTRGDKTEVLANMVASRLTRPSKF